MTKDTAECRALVMAFLSSSYAGSEDDERKVCAALDELDALRSRPSGLALEWRQVGTRDEYLQHNIYVGAFVFGAVIEFTGGWDAQAWEAGTTKYVARRVPLPDAKAALEAHVRSALGDHIADAGKMVLRPMSEAHARGCPASVGGSERHRRAPASCAQCIGSGAHRQHDRGGEDADRRSDREEILTPPALARMAMEKDG